MSYQFLPPLSDDLDFAGHLFSHVLGAAGMPPVAAGEMEAGVAALIERLARADAGDVRASKFVAVNPHSCPGRWLLAQVSPGLGAPWWHVVVIEHGGTVTYTRRAVPRDAVRWYLDRDSVTSANFREESAAESDANPYHAGSSEGESGPDIRPVYFIQADEGPIKIGVAASPLYRLGGLQTASPYPLRLLAVMPNQGALGESALHAKFAHLRTHGEWFRAAPDLLAYIKENGVPA